MHVYGMYTFHVVTMLVLLSDNGAELSIVSRLSLADKTDEIDDRRGGFLCASFDISDFMCVLRLRRPVGGTG